MTLRPILATVAFASTAACATILDFQEPIDRAAQPDSAAADEVAAVVVRPSSSSSGSSTSSWSSSASGSSSSSASGSGSSGTPASSGDAAFESKAPPATIEEPCVCVAGAPAGWSGPFVVSQGVPENLRECVGLYDYQAFVGHRGATAGPAECECSCGAPRNVACSTPETTLFTDILCLAASCRLASAVSCKNDLECDGDTKALAVAFGPSTPSGGDCLPSTKVTRPNVSWSWSIRLCASAQVAVLCDGGVCQSPPSPLFPATNRCLLKRGESECPAAYPVRQLFREGTDTRGCSPCECGAPSGVTCSAAASLVNRATCKVNDDVATPSACTAIGGGAIVTGPGTGRGGSCQPAGGTPVGTFVEGEPSTVCCLE